MRSSIRAALLLSTFGLPSRAYDAVICGLNGYSPSTGNVSYSSNAYNPTTGGSQCLSINDSVPSFESDWNWPKADASVHSYPYVRFLSGNLPLALANISSLRLTTQWGMGPSSTSVTTGTLDSSGLSSINVTANVAFDMFFDTNSSAAGDATTASTEVMIWLGIVGSAQPLGYTTDRSCFTQQLGSTDYTLYTGQNSRGTNVYTWVAKTTQTSFDHEISPLLQYLWRNGLISSNLKLGLSEFGTEAYNSGGNVTLVASSYSMSIDPGVAPTLQTRLSPREQREEQGINEKSVNPFDSDVEAPSTPRATVDPEKLASESASQDVVAKKSIWSRLKNSFIETYCPREEAPLVLPSCPTDTEKLSYLHTNRIPLYCFGLLSFLSLSAGMWLFVVSSVIFCWYGVFVAFVNFYLIISYYVGVIGKDWNYAEHLRRVAEYPINDETAPTIDVYLPVCMEPLEILDNTWEHIIRLDWPEHKLQIWVLDDGAQDSVKALAERFGFNYMVRDDRPRLKKAGNLRWAFQRTSGDFFTIFDADFCPRPDFLRELVVEHLDEPKSSIVQSPQFFRVTDNQTWTEQGAGATQELFYRVVQVNRDRWGASICVGSNAMYRREALVEVGGTADIGFSEDVHTGFGSVDRGWKVKYVPLCLATGVCPPTPRSFFSQQMRWARGSTTLLTNPHFWKSSLTVMQKICYLCGFFYYSAVSLSIFISPIPGILLLLFRPEWFKFYNLAFAIPSIVYGIVVFRFWAKASFGMNVQHIMVIQSYAYLTAIKDRIFNIELLWAASGDAKAHKSNKFRNMRLLCWAWTIIIMGGMITVVTYRIVKGLPWYDPIPLIVLNLYNFYVTHRFLFCNF
ncbi:nucleotide-diphospho-sugar transferase [Whalleya microplaca]|nr:nucleotide-diphospho-sugar transferase [Whalleya microplaca]